MIGVRTTTAVGLIGIAALAAACTAAGETPAAPTQAPPAIATPTELIQALVEAGWPTAIRSDPQAATLTSEMATTICNVLNSAVGDGDLNPDGSGTDNGDRLEEINAVYAAPPGAGGYGSDVQKGRRSLLAYSTYGCPTWAPMVQTYVDYADDVPVTPAPKSQFGDQARPEEFQWDLDGVYPVGDYKADGSTVPAGGYKIARQPGIRTAYWVTCSTSSCGVGGVVGGQELTADRALASVNLSDPAVLFRGARLTPHKFPDAG